MVLVSYPLHPPGKPDACASSTSGDLTVPCLFVHGTTDPFGTPDELTRWTATIPGAVTHHWVDGKGHDLKGRDSEVSAVVASWLAALD